MVKVAVEIFDHEDRIVSDTQTKYGFRNKNDALNFIIRKFEKHLSEIDSEKAQEIRMEDEQGPSMNVMEADIFQPEKKKSTKSKKKDKAVKKVKPLTEERSKQSMDLLKNILTER